MRQSLYEDYDDDFCGYCRFKQWEHRQTFEFENPFEIYDNPIHIYALSTIDIDICLHFKDIMWYI